ncbi:MULTISPECIES: hypothetical protein [Rhodococcus]|uniref:Integral membrane protein n=1 Tax=Rhodococcus opacus RKJ300 = JCM 13270 TaxID=1165867 RepID=I0WUZ1_RHOOP|nr:MULTISPECIES: hypothetical protein [Rhodococcus]EID80207.1 hypothetical protein W59_08334 [Rhodococcus opacus RKJ300 = JCM 13270]QQZ17721.1 hypothetical protein GO592_17460 [Rhodococcus sp. 21391]
MTDRFSVTSVLRAHWKGLSKPSEEGHRPEPDRIARLVLALVPLLTGIATFGLGVKLSSPGTLVAALSLLTGTLLTVFAQLSTLRLKLTEWFEKDDVGSRGDKDAIDESVAHVLVAALLSLVATVVTVAGIVLEDSQSPVLQGIVAAVVIALITYVLLLLIMLIPRLYGAYVSVNDIEDNLNGRFVDRTEKPMRRLDGH